MTALKKSRQCLARLCVIYINKYEGRVTQFHRGWEVPRAELLRIAENELTEALEKVRVNGMKQIEAAIAKARITK